MPETTSGASVVTAPTTLNLTFAEAVNAALTRALAEHPEALLFGEDVGIPGGVFGVTKGLRRKFGERVFDTPISEAAILGGAVGSSMMGRRPIVEIMWSDFTLVALDQIVNQAANVRYATRGELHAPITIRTQQGSAPGACAQHSQNLEALFTHIPGLRVLMPATPQDAYDLLLLAVADEDPTIVIENRTLYHAGKHPVRIGGEVSPNAEAAVRRVGRDMTLVTWGAIQSAALEAAERAAVYGVEVEVIDLRSLRPWDELSVIRSVEKTQTLLVVHEAHTVGGFGAEVVSTIVERGAALRRPPMRVGARPARIPAAPSLAEAVIPGRDDILEAILLLGGRR